MPEFINKSKNNVTVTFNGKKIVIHPNQTITGPEYLSIYTQLTKKSLVVNKENIDTNILEENRKAKLKNKSNHSTSTKEQIRYEPISIISKDEEKFVFNIKNTIKKTKNYINDSYKKGIPEVAISILSKDSYELINDCIKSIINKVKYRNTKIYIFDTGTTDKKVLNLYYRWTKNLPIPLEIINVGNFNFSKNYNDGLKNIQSEYVVIQNNDTVALNDYVSRLMRLLVLEKVGIVGPRMLYKDMTIQHDGQVLYKHKEKRFINPGHVNIKRKENEVTSGVKFVDGITGAGLFINRKLFLESGGFDEKYKDIYQDVDLNIKIRMKGLSILADLDAKIHHYDNTSRKKEWVNKEKLRQMWIDSNYLSNKITDKQLKYSSRKKYKISIVTLVNNISQYNNFLDDLGKQENYPSFEIIAIPNFNGEYSGCSEPLNLGLDIAESDYTILCHQDLRVPSNWLENIIKRINDLSKEKWGVLGMAGAIFNDFKNDGATYLTNEDKNGIPFFELEEKNKQTNTFEVQCLDELCMIVKTDSKIRFDEKMFNGFHLYGSDFCLQYLDKGYKNFSINAPCFHISDGIENLKNDVHRKSYMKDTFNLTRKWKGKFSKFRNMTAEYNFNINKATIHFADMLINEGFIWEKEIRI